MSRLAAASSAIVALSLAGCAATARPATVEGECRLLRPAPYAIAADTPTGQRWVDGTIEAGVRACGHPRPPERESGP